ncbi:hypothetical protein F4553_001969 [Allocatelliglobosispora scoriae]|uniref:CU044_5270 family protein n=1 Tax=Allocatelliglobosispora scoriae TaxID=643052 RepID=A0A841BP51_9ACTN|nr:CU044_5270 family protein [Allocatelliglobosispora scoriae]MBB5868590.1 hypothetical protein [Allocatelliglobosispora scoriae]
MTAHRPPDEAIVWPSHINPAAIMAKAQAAKPCTATPQPPTPSRRSKLRRRAIACGLAVTTLTGGVAFFASPASASPPAIPGTIDFDAASTESAYRSLTDLAEAVSRRQEPTAVGAYSFTRSQIWSLESDRHRPGADKHVMAQDEQLWWSPTTRSRLLTTLPPQQPDTVRAEWTGDLPPQSEAPRAMDQLGVNEISLVLDQTPADDADRLLAQVAAKEQKPSPLPPMSVLRTLADMCRYHVLNPTQRAAVLLALAKAGGLIYRGIVTDRGGRRGLAVSLDTDDHTLRQVLVFDRDNGSLLSREQITLVADDDLRLPAGSVTAYVLYLEHRTINKVG